MKPKPSPHGGARANSGRPRLDPDVPTTMYTIRLPAPLTAILRHLGSDTVRTHLERLARRKAP